MPEPDGRNHFMVFFLYHTFISPLKFNIFVNFPACIEEKREEEETTADIKQIIRLYK